MASPSARPHPQVTTSAPAGTARGLGICLCRHCRTREVLDRIGDKWSVDVISVLGVDSRRFTELLRIVEGISQRMLTVTVRGLERDGIVTRTVHPVVPPRVDYALTPMGRTLLDTIRGLRRWAHEHAAHIDAARERYDRANR